MHESGDQTYFKPIFGKLEFLQQLRVLIKLPFFRVLEPKESNFSVHWKPMSNLTHL